MSELRYVVIVTNEDGSMVLYGPTTGRKAEKVATMIEAEDHDFTAARVMPLFPISRAKEDAND